MKTKDKAEVAPAKSGQHTPGPWNILSPKGTLAGWRIASNDDCTVAFVVERLNNDAADSNARLIAAAPELLEALKECITPLGSDSEQQLRERLCNINGIARAAIAKAEGKQ
jgi:hypothetical protein